MFAAAAVGAWPPRSNLSRLQVGAASSCSSAEQPAAGAHTCTLYMIAVRLYACSLAHPARYSIYVKRKVLPVPTWTYDAGCVSDSVTMAAAMQDRERGTYMSSAYYYIMYVRLSLYYYYIIINMYMHVSRQQKTTSIIS